MKKAAYKSYIKKGQAIVDLNYAAIDAGKDALNKVDVPAAWANAGKTAQKKPPKNKILIVRCKVSLLKSCFFFKSLNLI